MDTMIAADTAALTSLSMRRAGGTLQALIARDKSLGSLDAARAVRERGRVFTPACGASAGYRQDDPATDGRRIAE